MGQNTQVFAIEDAVLKRLAKAGPATAADLARAEGMKPQSVGVIIVALEKMGMVERKSYPTDGRQEYYAGPQGAAVRKSAGGCKAEMAGPSHRQFG